MRSVDRRDVVRAAGLVGLAALSGGLTSCRRGPGDVAAPPTARTGGAASPADRPRDVAAPDVAEERRTAASPSPTVAAGTVELVVVCRRDWGAQPAAGGFRSHEPRLLTIHHTGVLARDGEGAARVRSHQRHHLDSGFADLAYHFIVSRDGTVFEGRPTDAAGETFTDYDPAGHFLPCLEGDFGRQSPTPAQVEALVGLLAWGAVTFDIPTATIDGHRSYASTACPGDGLQARVDDGSLRRAVDATIAGGGVRLAPTCA